MCLGLSGTYSSIPVVAVQVSCLHTPGQRVVGTMDEDLDPKMKTVQDRCALLDLQELMLTLLTVRRCESDVDQSTRIQDFQKEMLFCLKLWTVDLDKFEFALCADASSNKKEELENWFVDTELELQTETDRLEASVMQAALQSFGPDADNLQNAKIRAQALETRRKMLEEGPDEPSKQEEKTAITAMEKKITQSMGRLKRRAQLASQSPTKNAPVGEETNPGLARGPRKAAI